MKRVVFRTLCVVLAALLCACLPACKRGELSLGDPVVENGMIQMPTDADDLVGRDVHEVEDMFREWGFTNLVLEPHGDLLVGMLHADGEVEKITINGTTEFTMDSFFAPDQEIIITYHTYQVDETGQPNI